MTKLGADYISKLLNVGGKQEALPESITPSHSGLILTKKDFHLSGDAPSLPVTFVNREPKRINNEVQCLELRPQDVNPTMSTSSLNVDMQPSLLIDSAYGTTEV